jgi:hypothetical protein
MNKNELNTLDRLYELIIDIKNDNKKLNERLSQTVEELNKKVEKKHVPISLESDILQVVQNSMQKSIQECLTKYDSPLIKLITNVVNDNSIELKKIISDSFNDVIKKEEFKQSIKDGFSHKIARALISTNNSMFEKISNELKQDAVFKSKISIAIDNVVNECLNNK